jgi:hypothetical protein
MKKLIEKGLNVWEAWIEYDQFNAEYFGVLYVHGEMVTDRKCSSSFIKARTEDNQLIIQLAEPSSGNYRTKEFVYSQPIKNISQFDSIFVYEGDELITCLDDIEVMI